MKVLWFLFGMLLLSCSSHVISLDQIIQKQKNDPVLQQVLSQPEKYEYQIIYTQIDRDALNQPSFKSAYYHSDSSAYFYPASTVKMPTAWVAIEKALKYNIPLESPMLTDSVRIPQTKQHQDKTAQSGLPSIDHYVKKIFLVSDNGAYNRLYEFCGQQYLNKQLVEKGYPRSRIIHRLSAPEFGVIENRFTNPVTFYDKKKRVFHQDEVHSQFDSPLVFDDQLRGTGYIDHQGKLQHDSFDFSNKNYVALQDLHDQLKDILFPNSIQNGRSFQFPDTLYDRLYAYMSMLPRESQYPHYPVATYPDNYSKFLLFGDRPEVTIPPSIRIFNKIGAAYGTLTDVAYIVDFDHQIEFILAATILVNDNSIYNDGMYEYDEVGFPFMGALGRAIYQHELKRPRKNKPDLTRFQIDYDPYR